MKPLRKYNRPLFVWKDDTDMKTENCPTPDLHASIMNLRVEKCPCGVFETAYKKGHRDARHAAAELALAADARMATLEAELHRVRSAQGAAAHALDVVRQEVGLDLIDGEHPSKTGARIVRHIQGKKV